MTAPIIGGRERPFKRFGKKSATMPHDSTDDDAPRDAASYSRLGVGTAVAMFVFTRLVFAFVFRCPVTDVGTYFDYAVQGVDYGVVPYKLDQERRNTNRDLREFEYPPAAYWAISWPRELSGWRLPLQVYEHQLEEFKALRLKHYRYYSLQFRTLMLVFDSCAFALFYLVLRRRRPEFLAWGLWGYAAATSLIWFTLLERLDPGMTFFVLAWAYCWLRAGDGGRLAWLWSAAAYGFLGLGISYKLIPVLLVPFTLVCEAALLVRRDRDWRFVVGPVVILIAAVGPFAYYYSLVGRDVAGMFKFHAVRGVQVEATYATLMMLCEPGERFESVYEHGGYNIRGRLDWIGMQSTWLLVAVLGMFGLRWLAAPRFGESHDRGNCYRRAIMVLPAAIALSKVFSPQYLAWGAPLLLLAGAEFCSKRSFRGLVVATIILCGLTALLFPFHYENRLFVAPYAPESPPPWTLLENERVDLWRVTLDMPRHILTARNVLFVGLCTWLSIAALRRNRRSAG